MHPTGARALRRYVQGPFGQVHVYDTGGEGVPLVMLHQAPTSSLDFAATFPAFARAGQRLLAIDMPGFGMSDPPEDPPTIADYVRSTLATLDALGVEQADFLGHHTGSLIAVDLAADHPRRARKLALYGPALSTVEEKKALWDRLVPHEKQGRIHQAEPGGQNLLEQFGRGEAYAGPMVAQRMLLANLMAGPKLWYGHNAALTHSMDEAYARVRCPILLITNPGEMFQDKSFAMADLNPKARLVNLKVESAMAMDAAPDEFVDAVMAFLREG